MQEARARLEVILTPLCFESVACPHVKTVSTAMAEAHGALCSSVKNLHLLTGSELIVKCTGLYS